MAKPISAIIIMDGFGIAPPADDNAVTLANTPVLDGLFRDYAHTTLSASGLDVGLPAGQMGNSEVGHTNIGAGRVVYQELTRITKSIVDGEFFENPALTGAVQSAIDHDSALHLIGLMSDGGVHSHNTHLWALVELAKRMEDAGVQCLICTDIARDGMLSGPNLGQLTRIQRAVKCDIVASGGVTNLSDIAALRDCGLYGAICGRSIYKGTLSLREAIQIADIR